MFVYFLCTRVLYWTRLHTEGKHCLVHFILQVSEALFVFHYMQYTKGLFYDVKFIVKTSITTTLKSPCVIISS